MLLGRVPFSRRCASSLDSHSSKLNWSTRVCTVQDQLLFGWLATLYEAWVHLKVSSALPQHSDQRHTVAPAACQLHLLLDKSHFV